jgi:hypothetical protein
MASQNLDVLSDRFNSLAVAPNAWLLYLSSASGLAKGDILTVREVDSLGNYLGRFRTGVCNLTSTEQFIVYAKGTQCYYFNKLSNPMQIYSTAVVKNNVKTSFTGSLTTTLIWSVLIPAGTFALNDIFRFYIRGFTSAVVGSSSIRVYFNSTSAIAGATQIAISTIPTGTLGQMPLVRNMVFKNSLSVQEIIPTTSSAISDESAASTLALSGLTINFGVDQYFIVGVTLGAVGDTCGFESLYGEIIR